MESSVSSTITPPSINPTYQELHECVVKAAEQITLIGMAEQIDTVIGISRGGLLPGVIMSHQLNKPFQSVDYSSVKGNGDDKNHTNVIQKIKGETVLIVDDICDTGLTLNELKEHPAFLGKVVMIYTVWLKETSQFKPDLFSIFIPKGIDPWINFPFETKSGNGPGEEHMQALQTAHTEYKSNVRHTIVESLDVFESGRIEKGVDILKSLIKLF